MKDPDRTQWKVRCAFNGFCKRALRHEAIDIYRENNRKWLHEKPFSDLTSQEEGQLYTYDEYFADDGAYRSFFVDGKEITAKQLADAIQRLPDEKKKAVLLYYFMDMSDQEIANLSNVPRSTVQYRRTSSMELLRRYLEEDAYED
jgi:RNA polymerase sigma factor (sigma-70 family)